MDVGFVILCPDRNIAGLRNTIGSIYLYGYDRESVCVVGSDATAKEVKDFKNFCPTYKGGGTITGLINTGMKKIKHEWACIVFAGSRIPPRLEHKWLRWVHKETDILFPVVDHIADFGEGSFNGVLINTKFFKEVGDFPTTNLQKQGMNDFELAKTLWAFDAMEKGATFKAIVGMRTI